MIDDVTLTRKIEEITEQLPIYGYRRVTAILKHKYGVSVGRKRVYRIMKEKHLCLPEVHSKKKLFRGVPFSMKTKVDHSNTLWGIDMTYIWCGRDAWCYLHAVIDHHDKELLGFYFSRSCSAIGGVMALAEAASKRPVTSLELRSDNGCHYGAKVFKDEIKRLGIHHTRTMVNTPKGNSVIERFFRSLKEECVWQHKFSCFEEAEPLVKEWIERYNSERPHQTLGYLTPQQFYAKTTVQESA